METNRRPGSFWHNMKIPHHVNWVKPATAVVNIVDSLTLTHLSLLLAQALWLFCSLVGDIKDLGDNTGR